jgi:hypothetical protein
MAVRKDGGQDHTGTIAAPNQEAAPQGDLAVFVGIRHPGLLMYA